MEIVFVRHAEPEWVRDKLNVDNPPLTSRGFEQAELLGKWAATEHFDESLLGPIRPTHDHSDIRFPRRAVLVLPPLITINIQSNNLCL